MEPQLPDTASHSLNIIVTSCMNYFSPLDLVYISCSSKILGEICEARLKEGNRELAHNISRESVKTAAAEYGSESNYKRIWTGLQLLNTRGKVEVTCPFVKGLQRSNKALQWLLKKSGGGLLARTDRFAG